MDFNKAVVNKPNRCEYARLLINAQTKQIILVEAQKEDSNAYRFYNDKRRPNNKSVRWNSKELLNTVSRMMEWDLSKYGYRIDGIFAPEDKLFLFNLSDAKELS